MDRVYDTQRQEKARQEHTKNDKILYDSLLQVIHQTKDTTDKIDIIALCNTISLIDQIRLEERANRQAKIIFLIARDNERTPNNHDQSIREKTELDK